MRAFPAIKYECGRAKADEKEDSAGRGKSGRTETESGAELTRAESKGERGHRALPKDSSLSPHSEAMRSLKILMCSSSSSTMRSKSVLTHSVRSASTVRS